LSGFLRDVIAASPLFHGLILIEGYRPRKLVFRIGEAHRSALIDVRRKTLLRSLMINARSCVSCATAARFFGHGGKFLNESGPALARSRRPTHASPCA